MATPADNRIAYLGRACNSRVRPNDRILDNGFFLNMNAGTDDGVNNADAGLDRTALADNRQFVDLGVRRHVRVIRALDVKSGDPAVEEIVMGLAIAGRGADVEPILVGNCITKKWHIAFQNVGEDLVFK